MIDLAVLEKGSFVQQIMALDEIERSGDPEKVSPLTSFLGRENLDDSLRQALSDTLRALLRRNPSLVSAILADPASPALRMAVQLAGQLEIAETAAPLIRLVDEAKGDLLIDALSSLGQLSDVSTIATFRRFASNAEPFVAAVAIRQLGKAGDVDSTPFFKSIVDNAESDGEYEVCTFATGATVEALAMLPGAEAQDVLVAKIHHRNPTVRRLIHEVLISRGEGVVEPIARFLETGDTDEKIMAAALLGQIRSPRGAELILAAMDKGQLDDPNVRFAVYDAFGQMPSLKTMICLIDGLAETDGMTLVAVAASLNKMVNPGVVAKVGAALAQGGAQAELVAGAIIAAQAVELYKALYGNEGAAKLLNTKLDASRDPAIRETFITALCEIATPEALAQADRLRAPAEEVKKRRVLAVDDSRSILMFYRAMLSEMGFEVVTAENGKLALDVLGMDTSFDLIITDMNMPEMNGIELTQKVRENMFTEAIPVIMATTESDKSQIEMADHAGVTGYLVKPIKPDALKDTLGKIFG